MASLQRLRKWLPSSVCRVGRLPCTGGIRGRVNVLVHAIGHIRLIIAAMRGIIEVRIRIELKTCRRIAKHESDVVPRQAQALN